MKLMLLTNNEQTAREAMNAGVDRIFIDLEYIGKAERQHNLDTFIPGCAFDDIGRIKSVFTIGEVLARINPYHENTKQEIDECISQGADVIMLPMYKTEEEVESFIAMVDNRAKTSILLETPQALVRNKEIMRLKGIDELYIGLNDLHLGMGLDFLFELLSGGLVEFLSREALENNIPFGFGGLAKVGGGVIPAERILGEHYRLGSELVILSQEFDKTKNIYEDIQLIRRCEDDIKTWNDEDYNDNQKHIEKIIKSHLKDKRNDI